MASESATARAEMIGGLKEIRRKISGAFLLRTRHSGPAMIRLELMHELRTIFGLINEMDSRER
jgi:hypothetical protein